MGVDFTNAPVNKFRMYGGNNGNKINICFQGENYMLKFPPRPTKNPEMSYTNGCVSEYVACHIFESIGMETQKTLLGYYGNKIAVACKDFTSDGIVLRDFASLKNTFVESSRNGYGTELTENEECLNALKRIGGRINLAKINGIIDHTPYISKLHKDFLKVMIKERKEKIIDRAMDRV